MFVHLVDVILGGSLACMLGYPSSFFSGAPAKLATHKSFPRSGQKFPAPVICGSIPPLVRGSVSTIHESS
jgi:hypothetical protein